MRLSTIFLNSSSSHSKSFLLREGEELAKAVAALRALSSSRIHFSSSSADSDPICPLNRSRNARDIELEKGRALAGLDSRRIIVANAQNDIQIQSMVLNTERQTPVQPRKGEGTNVRSSICL